MDCFWTWHVTAKFLSWCLTVKMIKCWTETVVSLWVVYFGSKRNWNIWLDYITIIIVTVDPESTPKSRKQRKITNTCVLGYRIVVAILFKMIQWNNYIYIADYINQTPQKKRTFSRQARLMDLPTLFIANHTIIRHFTFWIFPFRRIPACTQAWETSCTWIYKAISYMSTNI